MVRLVTSLCAMLALTGAVAGAQVDSSQIGNRQAAVQRRLRNRPQPPQNNASFSPDPTLAAQPVAQPVAAQPAPVAQAPQQLPPVPQPQPAENLPPPTAAQVTYRNNLLTVQAMNSTLGGLLAAIRNKTGIQFEGLENGASERVAISMGPAPEGEVLTAILGGSRYDYVVVERPDSPGTVQRVLLSARAGGAPAAPGAAPAAVANNGEGDDEESTEEAENPQDTPVRPPITQVQPQQQPIQQPQAKTPEQLLQELKQMQQQQQQQQGQTPPQQNAPLKAPPIPQ